MFIYLYIYIYIHIYLFMYICMYITSMKGEMAVKEEVPEAVSSDRFINIQICIQDIYIYIYI
jgi:hypothetical protein